MKPIDAGKGLPAVEEAAETMGWMVKDPFKNALSEAERRGRLTLFTRR